MHILSKCAFSAACSALRPGHKFLVLWMYLFVSSRSWEIVPVYSVACPTAESVHTAC